MEWNSWERGATLMYWKAPCRGGSEREAEAWGGVADHGLQSNHIFTIYTVQEQAEEGNLHIVFLWSEEKLFYHTTHHQREGRHLILVSITIFIVVTLPSFTFRIIEN